MEMHYLVIKCIRTTGEKFINENKENKEKKG